MTPRCRHHWHSRRAVRTIAAQVYTIRERPARERLAVLASLAKEAETNMYAAKQAHNFMETQMWRERWHWLDGKRREATWKLKQGVTR